MTGVPCQRGALVSIEGLNGVGKTYLTRLLAARLDAALQVLVLEEFSARADSGDDLGRVILRSLITAANGDPFLRGGRPGAETLALLAVKMHDFESTRAELTGGRLVLEGRSIHSTAVYQSLISHPGDDEAAYRQATNLLQLAAAWRPLPDLTILITDDVTAAIERAERRDARTYTGGQRVIHTRAAALFTRLAADDSARIAVLDRRLLETDQLLDNMIELVTALTPGCLAENWRVQPPCAPACQLAHR